MKLNIGLKKKKIIRQLTISKLRIFVTGKIMKKILFVISLLLFATNIALAVPISVKKLKVVTTSPYAASIVRDICGNKIVTKNIFFNSSPSQVLLPWYQESYEVDAKTVKDISKSNVVLYHSWQPWIKNLKYRISKFGIVYHELRINGNLMVPETNLQLAKEITSLFSIWNGDNKDFYEKNFSDYNKKVNTIVEEIKENIEKFKGTKVVCSKNITPFMKRLGFDIIAEYKEAEYITTEEMQILKKKIKENKVKYIADSLQAGTDIGRALSEELKMKHIVISSIPLANSYVKTLEKNCETIFSQLADDTDGN